MFNFFKKSDSQRIALGLELFSETEYDHFIKLVKSDLTSRGIEVIGEKNGYLTAKVDGNEQNYGLLNLAQKCKLIAQSKWQSVIKEHFDAFANIKGDEAEIQKNITDFTKMKDIIAVQLYSDDYLNAMGEFKKEVITRSNIPNINSTLVLDLPTSIRTIKKSEVQAWDKTEDELFATALTNTFNKINPHIFEQQVSGGKVTIINSDSFLTAVLVLNLKKFNQCLGTYGSLVAIPTQGVIICYPIHDQRVVEVIPSFISLITQLHSEGPASLSPNLYWYRNDTFINLPYKIENGKLNFAPPQNFFDILNKLVESKS